MDWQVVGGAIATVGVAISGVWVGFLKRKKDLAESKVTVAEASAAASRAEASEAVFALVQRQLTDVSSRLAAAESKIDTLLEQVRERDNRIHALELHVIDLESTLRKHGIDPPARP